MGQGPKFGGETFATSHGGEFPLKVGVLEGRLFAISG